MLSLSTDEVKLLQKILQYVMESEEKNYMEHIANGMNEEDHIYHSANMLKHIINLKKGLPEIKLTGDSTLEQFINGGKKK